MEQPFGIDPWTTDWITPLIPLYALVLLFLCLWIYILHRARIRSLVDHVEQLSGLIEGKGPHAVRVPIDRMGTQILHLVDVLEKRQDLDIRPVLEYVTQNDIRQRRIARMRTVVAGTETMIDMLPLVGILGTVWAISGVGAEEVGSGRMLQLFGVAVGTTFWALLCAIVFRIGYSWLIEANVLALEEYNDFFQRLLAVLSERTGSSAPLARTQADAAGDVHEKT